MSPLTRYSEEVKRKNKLLKTINNEYILLVGVVRCFVGRIWLLILSRYSRRRGPVASTNFTVKTFSPLLIGKHGIKMDMLNCVLPLSVTWKLTLEEKRQNKVNYFLFIPRLLIRGVMSKFCWSRSNWALKSA